MIEAAQRRTDARPARDMGKDGSIVLAFSRLGAMSALQLPRLASAIGRTAGESPPLLFVGQIAWIHMSISMALISTMVC